MKFNRFCRHADGRAVIRQIRNHYSASAHDHIFADGNILNDTGANADLGAGTDLGAATNGRVGGEMYEVAEHTVMFHYRSRIDNTVITDMGARVDDRSCKNLRTDS